MITVSVERHRCIAMTLFHDDVFCPFDGPLGSLTLEGIKGKSCSQQSDACRANDW
jgi:hypothetical protein